MLSPAFAPPPPPPPPPPVDSASGTTLQSPTTRRRGLSYLRSLSSRDPAANTANDSTSPRTSPRHFFTRSTSYQETKVLRASQGRRRSQSQSRSDEPAPATSSTALTRVASERGAETQAETAPELEPEPEPEPVVPTTTATTNANANDMTRLTPSISRRQISGDVVPEANLMARSTSAGPTAVTNGDAPESKTGLPTIRFCPHQEQNRPGRQSLNFPPISRTLPTENSIIRVGRYSEREGLPTANPSHPSDAPVGFKSKVVSRKHCEFAFKDGQWQIRDVASSSGTFLNHIRLSQPNQESKLYPIKDGDIVQLGIDFRGGEEMIFRCVKIRIECNRSWQKKPNLFNKQRQAQLRGLAKDQPAANSNSGECSICLGNVLPCQALFVAPCAHCWHYKCIRPMLEGRNSLYPQFQCPNCRAYSDLEADVDVDMEEWAEEEESPDSDKDLAIDQINRPTTSAGSISAVESSDQVNLTNMAADETILETPQLSIPTNSSTASLLARRQDRIPAPNSDNLSPNNIPLPARPTETEMVDHLAQQRTQTESPNSDQIIAGEGPLTPRNNAGPFVFDGSGSRTGSRRHLNVPHHSLDEISDGIE